MQTSRDRIVPGTVVSSDGTTIGFGRLGSGPGIVVLHGAFESSESHAELAVALVREFTVYPLDRRGRGRSGPFGSEYSVQQEVEDVRAIVQATAASNLFGVSVGGIVALQAAKCLPGASKVAVYEPPIFSRRDEPLAFLRRFDREMAAGRTSAALVTAMKAAKTGPRAFDYLPRRLLEAMANRMMVRQEAKARTGDVTMRQLAPTIHYDALAIAEVSGSRDRFHDLAVTLHLLGGSRSATYLKHALDALLASNPRASLRRFSGLGHGGAGSRQWGGRPELVAADLREFFRAPNA